MKLNLLFNRKRKAELAKKQLASDKVHQNNIENIVQSRKNAERLKEVIEQNNIIIQIAGAIGH